jgi:CheY-like chemotaxis protein
MKVLVIDDEEMIRSLAAKILAREQHEVLTAPTGEEGLELLARHDDISCVVLDLTLPGISGKETLSRIREIRADLPCLLSSGQVLPISELDVTVREHTGFLEKPYRARRLIEAIEELLA